MEKKKITLADYKERMNKISDNLHILSTDLISDIQNTMLEISTAEASPDDEEKELLPSQKLVYDIIIAKAEQEFNEAEKNKTLAEKTAIEEAESTDDANQRKRLAKYPGIDTPLAYIFGWPSKEVMACREYQKKLKEKKSAK